jgi:hypothetical protein
MIAMMILFVSAERLYSGGIVRARSWAARLCGHRTPPSGDRCET